MLADEISLLGRQLSYFKALLQANGDPMDVNHTENQRRIKALQHERTDAGKFELDSGFKGYT